MGIFENYKNLFLHPREFAQDKLAEAWPWWAYALIVIVLYGVTHALMYAMPFPETAARPSIISAIVGTLMYFVSIFIINHPLRKDLTVSEYYQVNLAFACYTSVPVVILQALITMFMLTNPLILLPLSLLIIVLVIWILVSFCKIIAEIHDTSPWKAFGMLIIAGVVAGIVNLIVAFATTGITP